jgi:hypothetical protein
MENVMIDLDAVVIKPGADLMQALRETNDINCNDAVEAVMTDADGERFMHIEPEMVSNMV